MHARKLPYDRSTVRPTGPPALMAGAIWCAALLVSVPMATAQEVARASKAAEMYRNALKNDPDNRTLRQRPALYE